MWKKKNDSSDEIVSRMEKMMSICFTWFPISGLGEPKIYHQSVCITRMWILLRESDWWRHLRKHLGINSPNYFLYWCVGRCLLGAMVRTYGTVWLIGPDRHLYGHLNSRSGFLCRICWLVCGGSDFEKLVGEVNHTTEYVTDLFSFVDVEWLILYYSIFRILWFL